MLSRRSIKCVQRVCQVALFGEGEATLLALEVLILTSFGSENDYRDDVEPDELETSLRLR